MSSAAAFDAPEASAGLEIAVRTDAARIAAFRAATGAGADGPAVPLTFPFCWLASAEVRPALERMIGGAGLLPVHEGQSFDYLRPLALDADYRVAFSFARTAAPERLTVTAAIATLDGAPCASFETVLRLVAPARPGGADG